MKRDMNVIRSILLAVESDKFRYGQTVELDGVPHDVCAYHVSLILNAGLAEGKMIETCVTPYAGAMIHGLTSTGHDFCEAIKDESVWQAANADMKRKGAHGLPALVICVGVVVHQRVFIQHVHEGDVYSAGQVGAMGPNAHGHHMNWEQSTTSDPSVVNMKALVRELAAVRHEMRRMATTADHDIALGQIGEAEAAARRGDVAEVRNRLNNAGGWALSNAQRIGCEATVDAIKRSMTS